MSVWPHGVQPTRLLCPWYFPGKNTEWVAIPFSRGSSCPRDQTRVSSNASRFFTTWATRDAPYKIRSLFFFLKKKKRSASKTIKSSKITEHEGGKGRRGTLEHPLREALKISQILWVIHLAMWIFRLSNECLCLECSSFIWNFQFHISCGRGNSMPSAVKSAWLCSCQFFCHLRGVQGLWSMQP